MNTKRASKTLSLFLASCMVFTMLPLPVFAAELPETSIFSAVTVSPSSAKAGDTVTVTATVKEEYGGEISALSLSVYDSDGYGMDNAYEVSMTKQGETNTYQKEFVVPANAAIGACTVRIEWGVNGYADFRDYLTITGGGSTNETDPPVIGTPTVSPATASPGESVTVSVPVTDASAVRTVEIYSLSLPGYSNILNGEVMDFQSGSGDWQYTFKVPANALNGSYDMWILAYDEYQNSAEKAVTGALTITGGGTDFDGPVIGDTLTVNPTSAAKDQTVTVSATITDASALESVIFEVLDQSNDEVTFGGMTRQEDTATYQGTFTVPVRGVSYGAYGVCNIIVKAKDYYGNITEKRFENAVTLTDGSSSATKIVPAPILGVVSPTTGGVPQTAIPATDQYSASIEWRDPSGTFAGASFAAETVYRLQVALSAKAGYTFAGLTAADLKGFTVNGIVPSFTNPVSDSLSVIQVEFPATGTVDITKPTVSGFRAERTSANKTDFYFMPSTIGKFGYNVLKNGAAAPTELVMQYDMDQVIEYTIGSSNASYTAGDILVIYLQIENAAGVKSEIYSLEVPAYTALTDAQPPSISEQPTSATYVQNETAINLLVLADSTDGGSLSYQWYSNTTKSTIGATEVGTNSPSFAPPTTAVGTTYYYCVVTNTNNEATTNKTAKVTSNIASVTVEAPSGSGVTAATAADLKAALEATAPATISVTANIGITEKITLGASHTLVVTSGKTLSFTGGGNIALGSHTLTINGGGSLALGSTSAYSLNDSLSGTGTLNLANITVTVSQLGINVGMLNIGNGATVTLNGSNSRNMITVGRDSTCTVNSGGKIDIQDFFDVGISVYDGTLHINGGTVTVGPGQAGNNGIHLMTTTVPTKLKVTSGTLNGTTGGKIYFQKDTKAEGVNGRFSDRGTVLTASGAVTVGEYTAASSATGLTSGHYYWSGSVFAKHMISISAQPQNRAVTAGSISGSLSVSAAASNSAALSYQWWKISQSDGFGYSTKVEGAVSSTFAIPADLAAGEHYYYCALNADGCFQERSAVATVTVNAAGGGSYTPPAATHTPEPGKKPDQPVTAAAPVTATAGTNGTASAAIPDKAITDAIAKAQADAKVQGKTANGISVGLSVTMPKGATSLTVTLTQSSLNSLVSAGISQLEVNGAPVSLGLDLNVLKEIQKQSGGNISITIAPATGLSAEAKALLGNRPVYSITISYVKDGKTVNVSSLGSGTAILSIPYTPGKSEAVGYLFGVYVDAKGKAQRIPGSAYDVNSRSLLIPTGHFSVYGVGYTAPSAKFSDIETHWGKEAIDYVVGRGLLSGTSDTTFAPNTAMTRGMLVTALGRLANVDTKAYTKNSFTDVKTDSPFRPYIEWAYSKGVVQGISNQQFAPDRAITREEIAVIFENYAKTIGYKLPVTRWATAYADTFSIGSVYKAAVTAMQQAGIMMGEQSNKFNPKANATRAEVSAMLHRFIKLTINPATAQGWALNDDGQYMYYKDGKAFTGTQTIDEVKYFFNTDGTLKTGWVNDGDNWQYYSGNKSTAGWLDISDKRYYFTKDGLMVSGKWMEIGGKWYYFNADGSLAKNTKIDGYEVDKNGVKTTK